MSCGCVCLCVCLCARFLSLPVNRCKTRRMKNFDKLLCYNIIIIFAFSPAVCSLSFLSGTPNKTEHEHMVRSTNTQALKYYLWIIITYFHSLLCAVFICVCVLCCVGRRKSSLKSSSAHHRFTTYRADNGMIKNVFIYLFCKRRGCCPASRINHIQI